MGAISVSFQNGEEGFALGQKKNTTQKQTQREVQTGKRKEEEKMAGAVAAGWRGGSVMGFYVCCCCERVKGW